jgi:general secretion pathway protein K
VGKVRQDGVALVTALLVTALAVTLVSNLFWQQQVMVRAMEGQQLRLQARLLLHDALDEARLALRDAAAAQGNVTTLEGRWNTPLPANGDPDGLRREIIDAQSRFNLRNLAPDAGINPYQLAAFARLLATLKIDPALAPGIAEALAAGPIQGRASLAVRDVDDLLSVPGVTPPVLARLRPFVTVLPEPTGVNVNTASAEVLTSVANLTLQDAQALVARRGQAHFRDTSDFALRLNERETLEGVDFHVSSDYFLVAGRVTLERVRLDAQALVRRQGERGATLLWLRER